MEVVMDSSIKSKVRDLVQGVLDRSFSGDKSRSRLVHSHDRLNFACPYCGDSASDPHKKRGNIFWRNSNYHCFNCFKHTSVDDFLKDFGTNLDMEDRVAMVKNYRRYKNSVKTADHLEFGLFKELKELSIPRKDFLIKMNVYPINERTERAYPYLKSRMLHRKLEYFAYNPKTRRLFIFNLDASKEHVISYQIRNLDGYGNKYASYKMSRMRQYMGLKMPDDEEHAHQLDLLSMHFGILSVDFSSTFTIFEGPLDALFMPNSIALTGAMKNSFNFDEIDTVRYFLDDDPTGNKASIDKLKIGSSVFLWSKFKKDHFLQRSRIKDLNQLILFAYKKKRPEILENLSSYFSTSKTDVIHV